MSGTLWPARVVDTDVVHLAWAEGEERQLIAVCPTGKAWRPELELVPVGARTVWCGDCKAYREHLEQAAALRLPQVPQGVPRVRLPD